MSSPATRRRQRAAVTAPAAAPLEVEAPAAARGRPMGWGRRRWERP